MKATPTFLPPPASNCLMAYAGKIGLPVLLSMTLAARYFQPAPENEPLMRQVSPPTVPPL